MAVADRARQIKEIASTFARSLARSLSDAPTLGCERLCGELARRRAWVRRDMSAPPASRASITSESAPPDATCSAVWPPDALAALTSAPAFNSISMMVAALGPFWRQAITKGGVRSLIEIIPGSSSGTVTKTPAARSADTFSESRVFAAACKDMKAICAGLYPQLWSNENLLSPSPPSPEL